VTLEIFVLSCDRYEMLALCLAGLCGHNAGTGAVTVIDDASEDPRVHELLRRCRETASVARVVATPRRMGVGVTRRMAVDLFLAGQAETMAQVEGDVLLGPGALAQFAGAWRDLHEGGFPVNWLCAHAYDWCHRRLARVTPPAASGCTVEFWDAQGESLWLASRAALERHGRFITRDCPDLTAFHRAAGCAGLERPVIAAQHLGCVGASFYYPPERFPWATWERLCYRGADGAPRQPYPDLFRMDFESSRHDWRKRYAEYARLVARHAPAPFPELP